MTKVKLYRLERNGLGPFTQYIDGVEYFKATCEDVKFKKGDNKNCFLYACESEAQLEEYFGEKVIDQLLEVGFQLQEYEVPQRRIRTTPNKKQYAFHTGSTDSAMTFALRKTMDALNKVQMP